MGEEGGIELKLEPSRQIKVKAEAERSSYITLTHYRPSSRPALMWPLHKLASHHFRCLEGTAVGSFAKYLKISHDKKRQQQMKNITAATGTHKMLCFLPLALRMGQGEQSVSGFMGFSKDTLPHTAACLPRANIRGISTIKPLSIYHPLSHNARGVKRFGVFSDICMHNGSDKHSGGASCSYIFKKGRLIHQSLQR